jgi:photosystem II stability/assembly factor-like uncharacterized protein
MKKNLTILAILLFAVNVSAQEKLFINETSFIRTISFYGYCEPQYVQFLQDPYALRFRWDLDTRTVTGFFTTPGTYYDTARFYVYYPYGSCPMSGEQSLQAVATVYSDSVIRMLPRKLDATATADMTKGGWTASLTQRLKHKIGTASTFSDWKLSIDTNLKATLEIRHKGVPLDKLIAQPFDDSLNVEYVVHTGRGPIYDDRTYDGEITVRVVNKDEDSLYRTPVKLRVTKPKWEPWFGFAQDTIRLTAIAGEVVSSTVGMKLDPFTTSFQLPLLRGNISRSVSSIKPGDSAAITLSGTARTAGTYRERLDLVCSIPDHNGDPRTVRDSLWIELTVTGGGTPPPYWEPTDGALLTAKYLGVHQSTSQIYAASEEKMVRSTDNGRHWTRVSIRDTSIRGLVVDNSNAIYIIGDSSHVRSSTNEGATWNRAVIGDNFYQISNYSFLPYRITSLVAAGDNVYASGDVRYYDAYQRRQILATGGRATFDGGRTWAGFNFSLNGFLEAQIQTLTQDSSYNYLLGTSYYVYHPATKHRLDVNGRLDGVVVDGYGNFYALTSNGLYSSTDIGYSWQRRSLIFDSVCGFAVAGDGELFVATASAVYHSSTQGEEWEVINAGLGSTKITSLALLAGGKVFVGTVGGGVYRSIADTKPVELARVNGSQDQASLGSIIIRGDHTVLVLRDEATHVEVADLLGRPVYCFATNGCVELPKGPLFVRLTLNNMTQFLRSR